MGDRYDARDYMFTLYYDQHDETWVAEAEGTYVNADHPTSHLSALAELERKLSGYTLEQYIEEEVPERE